jgi:hypothetical protein
VGKMANKKAYQRNNLKLKKTVDVIILGAFPNISIYFLVFTEYTGFYIHQRLMTVKGQYFEKNRMWHYILAYEEQITVVILRLS